jgi:flavoprotein
MTTMNGMSTASHLVECEGIGAAPLALIGGRDLHLVLLSVDVNNAARARIELATVQRSVTTVKPRH